jgi:hypothetical protein
MLVYKNKRCFPGKRFLKNIFLKKNYHKFMCTEVICKLTSLWPSGCVSSQICMMDTGTCRRVPHSWEGKPKGTRVRSIMAVCQWNVCNCVVVWPFTHCPEEQEGTVMALWNRYASENCSCPADAMSYNTIYNSLSFSLSLSPHPLCCLWLWSTSLSPIPNFWW